MFQDQIIKNRTSWKRNKLVKQFPQKKYSRPILTQCGKLYVLFMYGSYIPKSPIIERTHKPTRIQPTFIFLKHLSTSLPIIWCELEETMIETVEVKE